MRRDSSAQPVRRPRTEASEQSFAFRRSRTITGSASTNVRAAGEERGQLQSPRLHEHSLRKHRRKLSVYLGLSTAGAVLLWYVVSSYVGASVEVGTKTAQPTIVPLDHNRYSQLVHHYLAEHPFEQFTFARKQSAFNQYMVAAAPEVSSASLDKGSGIGAASLTLQLREPVVAWTIKNQPYFVDATGVAFTKNYFPIPSVVVTDKSGISADAGVLASSRLLHFIGRVITLIRQSGISAVQTVELPQSSTREVDFKLTDKPYIIKANLDRDPAGQATDIVNAVKYVSAKGITPQYLDVRVSSKAFYRD